MNKVSHLFTAFGMIGILIQAVHWGAWLHDRHPIATPIGVWAILIITTALSVMGISE